MPQNHMPKDWEPPYPSYSAEFGPEQSDMTAAYFGRQARDGGQIPVPEAILQADHGPNHIERAAFEDAEGYRNDVVIAYWRDRSAYEAWSGNGPFADWWGADARLNEGPGYWKEAMTIPASHFETLFSSTNAAGMAATASGFTGEIEEHAYWGGMRDRIPASDESPLASDFGDSLSDIPPADSFSRRLSVTPPENLCLIRSAQDWGDCRDEELRIYKEDIQPVLTAGMAYIRDNPLESGCVSCRFMDELTLDGQPQTKTFGMAWFLSMAHLEAWAKSHPSHLAIFGAFHKMVTALDGELDIKLWHEVVVLPRGNHSFEYINCHPGTGALKFFPSD